MLQSEGSINKLKDYFSRRSDITMAFLFGSYSKQRQMVESDVDIAVFFDKEYTNSDISRLWGELEDILKHDVDLIILNHAAPTVAWEAIRGIPLLMNYRFYLEYMLEVSREAEDFSGSHTGFVELLKKGSRKVKGETHR